MCTMFGAIIAVVCCYKGMTASGGAGGGRPRGQPGGGDRLRRASSSSTTSSPRSCSPPTPNCRRSDEASSDDRLARRPARLARLLRRDRPLRRRASPGWSTRAACFSFFGESLRQAGILILGSALIIWAFVFILGLQCGLQGAYFNRSIGAPVLAGLFSAYCDLREGLPYAFGYILSAKVGTGIVAELGAMRISDEIDALEVMGIPPVTFLCRDPPARRLDRAAVPLPGRDRGRSTSPATSRSSSRSATSPPAATC